MGRQLMIVLIDARRKQAPAVQEVLTGWGCSIKTRIGIHDGVLDKCSDNGLIILELVGEEEKQKELAERLNALPGVKTRMVDITS